MNWVILATIFVGALLILLVVTLLERFKRFNKLEYQAHWQKIESYLTDEDKYPLAIIEADKLLDKAFKERGFRGQTTSARLVSAGKYLSNKEAVWQSHKLRNRLVHETGFQLQAQQTKKALLIFAQALRDLGAL